MNGARIPRLQGIQALRGIAAFAVVAYHAGRHIGQAVDASVIVWLTKPGHAGVDLFFALSGFIILHVHRQDIGRPRAIGRYAWQRIVRLFPIYWVALGVTILMMLLHHSDAVTSARIALSASLLPVSQDPLLGVAWTLQHEVLFYSAFGILILSRALGLACFCLWFAWICAQGVGLVPDLGQPRFSSLFNLQFLFGMAAALAVSRGWIKRGGLLALGAAACLLVIGGFEVSGRMDGYGNMARLAYGVFSALLIAGLAAWESAHRRRIPKLLVAVGEASYSIYLFHLIGIGVVWQAWLGTGIDTATHVTSCYVFLLMGALICGVAVHYLIEVPILRRLRRVPNPESGGSVRFGSSAIGRLP